MYAIYGNMDPINIPQMLAYIPAPWILWVMSNNEIVVIVIIMIGIIRIRVFLIIEFPSMIRVVPRPEDDNSKGSGEDRLTSRP